MWYILWPFGNVVVIRHVFPPFWLIVSRKIWQPWFVLRFSCSRYRPAFKGLGTPPTKTVLRGSSGSDASSTKSASESLQGRICRIQHFCLLVCFLRGSVMPFPIGFCYRQVAILLFLLGITIIISPPYHQNTQSYHPDLHSLLIRTYTLSI
jgi:hypothetical protein